ncbi:DUF262 domain-containing protein [Chryseobacterium formosus]|uniref:DUF262 domain-containing protein n=1 Tax=Chryseobacterium formosus TaxID=1537363 RepID=A0ABT3XRD0_9FLAO|nr:DUF262 domain-containing protein [Chryseobacterium formosus]MCX8524689.1 DUF262 domain-containing protein [Chryseobacterium formosus]
MNENLKNIEELLDFSFIIDAYQRGYRWDTDQVYSLLTDIDEFTLKFQSFYCLQPLVVRKIDDNTYELIDGQQRATTISLILMFFKSKSYRLRYTTRNTEESGINSFIVNIPELSFPEFTFKKDLDNFNIIDSLIFRHWKENIILNNSEIDNVDNFYFYKNYVVIHNWFEQFDEEEKEVFKHKLLKNTKVIWYVENETTSDEKIIEKFINFNEGKIELEQAELIKALFVLDIAKTPNAVQRQYEENQFADDWNLIEHQMGDDKFWQFITSNKNDENIANKINLVFQLHNGFGKSEDKFYNYRKFENSFKNSEEKNKPNWSKITQLYNGLEEWFFDRTSYHLIGAIIHLTNFNISTILEKAQESSTKVKFRNELRKLLGNEFLTEKFNLELIKYNDITVFKMLFLFNIALTEIDDTETFFPFYRFYETKNWNIEHILAKNDDGLDTFEEFKTFHREIDTLIKASTDEEVTLENKNIIKVLLDELAQLIYESKKGVIKQKAKEINDKVAEFFSVDDFNNLCLLDQSTNIKVGKKPFRRKRNIILKLDDEIEIKPDTYIPMGTEYVFSKKSTKSEFYQIDYWSLTDRESYLKFVQNTISKFLTPEQDERN